MKHRTKNLIKNTGILTLSSFASKLLSFFLVPLYTSVLSTEEFGNYDIILSTLTILLPLVTLNISDAVMRFTMDKEKEPEKAASVGLWFTISGIAIAILLSIAVGFTPLIKYVSGLRVISVVFFAALAFNSYLTQLAKGKEKVLDMGIAGILGTVTAIITNLLFLLVFKMGLKGFFYAGILGSAIPDIYYFFRLKVWNYFKTGKVNKEYVKEMIAYSSPLILVVIGWTINSNLDKYMVTAFCGLAANGLLAIAYKIPNILSAVQGIFTQAWHISAITEFKSEDSDEFYKTVFNYCTSFSSVFCAALIILSRPIASLIYAKDFYEAWQYVPFLLISFLLNFAAGIIGPMLTAKMDSKSMAKSAIGGIIVNAVMNYVLIKSIGIQGAAIATAVSSLCILIIRRVSVSDIIPFKNDVRLYLSILLLTALACVEIILQNYLIEIGIFILIAACNYKQIVGIIKKCFLLVKERK